MRKLAFLIILLLTILIFAIPTNAYTPINQNYVRLEGVTISYDYVPQNDMAFILMDNSHWYLDYDGGGLLSNGLFPLYPVLVTIKSTNIQYSRFEFIDESNGQSIIWDMSILGYVSFYLEYDSINDKYTITVDDDDNVLLVGQQYGIDDAYFRVYDEVYFMDQIDVLIARARQQGLIEGQSIGYSQGIRDTQQAKYNEGYHDGAQDYYNGSVDSSLESLFPYSESYAFGQGFNLGASNVFNFRTVLSWIFMPFDIFEKEIAYGVTIGHFALITIVFGFMGFLYSVKKGKG